MPDHVVVSLTRERWECWKFGLARNLSTWRLGGAEGCCPVD
ncbi:hypothetical protein X805_31790 [Sphaerotilus natans subsp. natans DSM 6575]|uniref:Uncharacterized protein n=1 Tax=Sphaerotilus natans subsp. natans DSM 6575 TaxID=1286631 RepID=A0A059KIM8_9BURK|nr:hypothetical protein X805_31790 [Sphaerotilus natans subsp. natans DSM 6575]